MEVGGGPGWVAPGGGVWLGVGVGVAVAGVPVIGAVGVRLGVAVTVPGADTVGVRLGVAVGIPTPVGLPVTAIVAVGVPAIRVICSSGSAVPSPLGVGTSGSGGWSTPGETPTSKTPGKGFGWIICNVSRYQATPSSASLPQPSGPWYCRQKPSTVKMIPPGSKRSTGSNPRASRRKLPETSAHSNRGPLVWLHVGKGKRVYVPETRINLFW